MRNIHRPGTARRPLMWTIVLLAAVLFAGAGCAGTSRHPLMYGSYEEGGISVRVLNFQQEFLGPQDFQMELEYRITNNSGSPVRSYQITMDAVAGDGTVYPFTIAGGEVHQGENRTEIRRFIYTPQKITAVRPVEVSVNH